MNLYAMCLATGGGSGWFAEFARTFEKCFIREDRYKLLLEGIGVTIKISLLAAFLGLIIGFLIAICSLSIRALRKVNTVNFVFFNHYTTISSFVKGCRLILSKKYDTINENTRTEQEDGRISEL
mgnify:CR=1 FL=1